MSQPNPEETTRLLTRLAQKPGVSSTLILSRSTGAVVRASGLVSTSTTTAPDDPINLNAVSSAVLTATDPSQVDRDAALNNMNGEGTGRRKGTRSAEEVAKLVWSFFKQAGDTVDGMFGSGDDDEGDDEVKLVRLRTRKSEVVVVPDAKFLLCVIHDTPPA